MEESEAMVIVPQTDLGLTADTTMITTSPQLQTLPMPVALQLLQIILEHMLRATLRAQILMLLMVGMRHMFNTISSTWQLWLSINNNKVLLARLLLHPQARLPRHHLADRYV